MKQISELASQHWYIFSATQSRYIRPAKKSRKLILKNIFNKEGT